MGFWSAQGRQAVALGWARKRDLFVDDDLSYLHEFEHLTLARVFMARYENDPEDSARKAAGLLERLLQAEDRKREGESDPDHSQCLIEQFSPRELEALRLVAQGFSNLSTF